MLPKASSSQSVNKQQFTLEMSLDKQFSLNGEKITFDQIEPKLTQSVAVLMNLPLFYALITDSQFKI